ncbi:MAG: glycoside hydrolase family 97 catalytic domain-containing protein [bacterium]
MKSPNGISVSVIVNASGRLAGNVSWKNNEVTEESPLGISVDGVDFGDGVSLGVPALDKVSQTFATRGWHSAGRLNCNAARIPVTHIKSKSAYTLEVRACEDGVAYRYIVPGSGKRTVSGEATSWKLPGGVAFWYQTDVKNYEDIQRQAISIEAGTKVGPPITVFYPAGFYSAISEAGAPIGYSGMTLVARENNLFEAEFLDDPGGWAIDGEITTPWRVILIEEDLTGLVNSDLIFGLNPPPTEEIATAKWIRPGRSLWNYLNPETAVTPENMMQYVDAANQLGFEYVLVDEGWKKWSAPGKDFYGVMADLAGYAKGKSVGIWVWTHYSDIIDPDARDKHFSRLAEIGVVGNKIDFMDSESQKMLRFYDACRRDAAKRHLMVNFHGANKPTGETRAWPNEMTREGIRGFEYRSLPLSHLTTLPFTRFLAGHADFTPMHFSRAWMGSSTRMHQLAMGFILGSPVEFFGGSPKDFLRSPAVDIIKTMPTVWDETVALPPTEIGKTVAFALRSGETWYVAILNGDFRRTIDFKLDFLNEGNFAMEALQDSSSSASGVKRVSAAVTKNDSVQMVIRPAGGYVAKIVKAQ